MGATRVVARYADGRVAKDFTQDFFPNKDRFHLILEDNRKTVASPETTIDHAPYGDAQVAARIVDALVRWSKERKPLVTLSGELDPNAPEFDLSCKNQ